MSLCSVVPMSGAELAKKTGHADWTQGLYELVYSEPPQLSESRAASIDCLQLRIHDVVLKQQLLDILPKQPGSTASARFQFDLLAGAQNSSN